MKLALSLGAITTGTVVVAFLHQWAIIVALGPGRDTDALFAGLAVPQLILSLISSSLTYVLVPLLSGEEPSKAKADAWVLLAVTTAIFSVAAGLLFVTASLWAPFLFPGFSPDSERDLLVKLTRIQLFGMIFTATFGVISAYYHSQRRFIRIELTQLLIGAISLTTLFLLLPRFGVVAAAWLGVFRSLVHIVTLVPALGKPGHFGDRSTIRATWERLRPLLVGTAYYKTDTLLDRILSSIAPPGVLSLLYLGQQIYAAANQVINTALAAPLVPLLASLAKEQRWEEYTLRYRRRVLLIAALTATAYLLVVAAGERLLALIVGHGGVTPRNVEMLWFLLVALGGSFVGGSIGQVSSSIFYAQGDTRTPTQIGIVTYTIYVPLKILAFVYFGIVGLAVSTSFFFIVNVFLQLAIFERRMSQKRLRERRA